MAKSRKMLELGSAYAMPDVMDPLNTRLKTFEAGVCVGA